MDKSEFENIGRPSDPMPNGDFEKQILQKVSRSFALTIPQLPPELSKVVANAYLLCRIVDTIEDEATFSIDQQRIFFDKFSDVVNDKLSAGQFADELYPLLSDQTLPAERELILNTSTVIRTFFNFNIHQQAAIRRCVETMSSGMLEFKKIQNPYGLETLAQLNAYCYYVAGLVGEMLTTLFCHYSTEVDQNREKLMGLAASFGQGLQMTNILKDLWEDKERGACWLPRDVFRKAGFDLNKLSAGDYKTTFGEGLAALVATAHGHLKNSLTYTLLFPRHETGIRKFCLWAIGMGIFTLQNINRTRNFTSAGDVKIPRRTTRTIITVSNATLKSNLLLKILFKMASLGLPTTDPTMYALQPALTQLDEEWPIGGQRRLD
jgi:farnesyl-diphosphate farnesyltransferase